MWYILSPGSEARQGGGCDCDRETRERPSNGLYHFLIIQWYGDSTDMPGIAPFVPHVPLFSRNLNARVRVCAGARDGYFILTGTSGTGGIFWPVYQGRGLYHLSKSMWYIQGGKTPSSLILQAKRMTDRKSVV